MKFQSISWVSNIIFHFTSTELDVFCILHANYCTICLIFRKRNKQTRLQMLTNNYKRLNTDNNRWLLGGCEEGVFINELAPIKKL
jgi:hypothetical protein